MITFDVKREHRLARIQMLKLKSLQNMHKQNKKYDDEM